MIKLGRKHKNVVFLYCDGLENSDLDILINQEDKRSFDFGLGVANMFSAAAGFAQSGKLPIVFVSADLFMRGAGAFYSDNVLANLNVKVVVFGEFDEDLISWKGVDKFDDLEEALEKYGPTVVLG